MKDVVGSGFHPFLLVKLSNSSCAETVGPAAFGIRRMGGRSYDKARSKPREP